MNIIAIKTKKNLIYKKLLILWKKYGKMKEKAWLDMSAISNDIFSNIPKKDYLSLLNKGEARGSKVVEFVGFKKNDVAKAAGIPPKSIRYDARMPRILKDRLREWANLFNLVAQFFEGDAIKTALWFKTPNPMLGNISPKDMILCGRYQKLLKFIHNALSENQN